MTVAERESCFVTFVTTVRHPDNSRDYGRIERYLDATLRSILNQADPDFRIFVVCNRTPSNSSDYAKTTFIEVDFAPPVRPGKPIDRAGIVLDRGTKHAVALAHIRDQIDTEYIMFFDSDDLLSNRLVATIRDVRPDYGLYAETGYSMPLGYDTLTKVEDFFEVNGNSNIFRSHLLINLVTGIEPTSSQEQIVESIDKDIFRKLLAGHKFAKDFFAANGMPFDPLPLPPAIWILGNMENRSGWFGKPGTIPLKEKLIEEFSIPEDYIAKRRWWWLIRLIAKIKLRLVGHRRD
jgi:glycosyltransferase involved in cell wall biosynthesis